MTHLYSVLLRKYRKNHGANVSVFLELRSVIPIHSSFYVHGRADSLQLFIVLFVHYLHVLTKTHSQLARMQMIRHPCRFPKKIIPNCIQLQKIKIKPLIDTVPASSKILLECKQCFSIACISDSFQLQMDPDSRPSCF